MPFEADVDHHKQPLRMRRNENALFCPNGSTEYGDSVTIGARLDRGELIVGSSYLKKICNAQIVNAFISSFEKIVFPYLATQGFEKTPFRSNYFGKDEYGGCEFSTYRLEGKTKLISLSFSYLRGNGNWQVDYIEYDIDRPVSQVQDLEVKNGTYLVQADRYKRLAVRKRKNWWIIKPTVVFGLNTDEIGEDLNAQTEDTARIWTDLLQNDMGRIRKEWSKWYGPNNPIIWDQWPEAN